MLAESSCYVVGSIPNLKSRYDNSIISKVLKKNKIVDSARLVGRV